MAKPRAPIPSLLSILLLCTAPLVQSSRSCYFPSGSLAPENVPCSNSTYSACCGKNDICHSNGLCMDVSEQPYVLSHGACTDADWTSPNCPSVCQTTNKSDGCSTINLLYTNGISTYCCGTPISNGTDVICPDGKNSFELESGSIVVGYAALENVTSLEAAATTTTTTTTSGASSAATTGTSGSGSTTSSTSTTVSKKGGSSLARDAAIGAGVGVPFGVIAIASMAWAVWERTGRQRMLRVSMMVKNGAGAGGNCGAGDGGKYHQVVGSGLDAQSVYAPGMAERKPVELGVGVASHELQS